MCVHFYNVFTHFYNFDRSYNGHVRIISLESIDLLIPLDYMFLKIHSHSMVL